MIHSSLVEKNPHLLIFLPILHTVWSDSILTPSEIKTLRSSLDSQPWLSGAEKQFLLQLLDPSNPPTPDELKDWSNRIKSVIKDAEHQSSMKLVDLGILLTREQANGTFSQAVAEAAQAGLSGIDEQLGLIPGELLFNYFPERRKTITASHQTTGSFDIAAMSAMLDGSQADTIRKVKTLLTDPAFRYIETDSLLEYRTQVLKWCKLLAEQGYGAAAYPKEYGGSGDMERYFTIMETLSYHDLSMVVKFGVQFGLFGMSIYFLGTEKHHRKYLQSIGTLELPGCFAMTETGHGSNVRGIETTATFEPATRTFDIHTPDILARKEYIGNAALHGRMATVFAKLMLDGKDYGVVAILVPLRNIDGSFFPGVTIEDCGRKMGLNGVDNGKINFDHVKVPYDNLLDRFASISPDGKFVSPIASDNRRFFTMLGTLVGGRIGIPRSGLSASKSGLAIAIRYGDQRPQFGPEGSPEVPILNYRTHQRRLMPYLANAYALHFALQYLTSRFIHRNEEEMQEIEALAAGLKAFATWNCTSTLQECRECCGGKGYLSENRIERLKNDSDIYTTFEGDNTVLMQLVAKGRLSEFKEEFSHMKLRGVINFMAEQAGDSLSTLNPFFARRTDDDHLLDFKFLLEAFEYRERHILISAANRLRKHIRSGMDSFDAFNVSQHHLVQVGFAHVERVILEQFIEQVETTQDSGCKAILTKLCQLFALSQIEKNKGWYLETGYMEGSKTKAIRKLVNQLCWDIRQDAVPLVDAFGIPAALLAAPIATK